MVLWPFTSLTVLSLSLSWLVTINFPNISLFPVFSITSIAAWGIQASTISCLHHLSFSSLLEIFTKYHSDQIIFLLSNSQGLLITFCLLFKLFILKIIVDWHAIARNSRKVLDTFRNPVSPNINVLNHCSMLLLR